MRTGPAIDVTLLVPGLLGPGTGPGGAGAGLGGAGPGAADAEAPDTAESPPPAASGARSGATGFRGFFPALGIASRVRARSAADASEAAEALVAGLDLHALDRLLARAGHAVDPPADDSIEALAFRSFGYADRSGAVSGPALGDADRPGAVGGPALGDATGPGPVGQPALGDATGPGPAVRPAPGDATGPGADWPVAAVTAFVDGEADGDGPWLRADPVHLRPDIADLVLFDAVDAGVSGEEARALAQAANEALRPGGPFVRAAHPHRWYVALEAPARMTTTPPSLAAGAGVAAAMPDGPDAARWRRWMNVVQMALHESPVNAERERRGAVPINSVWLWGGGRPPAAPEAPAPFVRAWTGDALVRGLARRAGIECGAPPAGAGAWLDRAPRPGAHLIGFDALYRAARRSDLDAWRAGLADFSASWAKPLLDALDRGDVARVSIHDERGHRFVATRRGRWRWRGGGLATRIAGAFASRP